MTTPIDRENVERFAHRARGCADIMRRYKAASIEASELSGFADTLLALRAALDAAEADKQLAVAAALREAAEAIDCGCGGWCMHPDKCPKEDVETIFALIPDAGAALDRALAAKREQCAKIAFTMVCGFGEPAFAGIVGDAIRAQKENSDG